MQQRLMICYFLISVIGIITIFKGPKPQPAVKDELSETLLNTEINERDGVNTTRSEEDQNDEATTMEMLMSR